MPQQKLVFSFSPSPPKAWNELSRETALEGKVVEEADKGAIH